ncbi:hypothetical protein C5B42_02795 [Candidatus Cerribacteria bacterium 'Amazon FNV 2010 28 9']|uniref:Uncharacterized protein n=1 Tax=Candidatus Cerribacteria bacterium 'Amazon FNV 2010 28 9' TaxID=2081795 RepID=A0A317JRH4_9BACT|nr:MAG: hypothetical protein C5B42_02795 [Candidatus Cerribacteria bacterium 'Amazon FNV 2010 28 9']
MEEKDLRLLVDNIYATGMTAKGETRPTAGNENMATFEKYIKQQTASLSPNDRQRLVDIISHRIESGKSDEVLDGFIIETLNKLSSQQKRSG